MGRGAGEYRWRFMWLRHSLSDPTPSGARNSVWTDNGVLYGAMRQMSAQEALAYGAVMSQAAVVVTIHNQPALDEKDRLRCVQTGELLDVDGITHDLIDLTVYCHVLPSTLEDAT